MQKTRYNPTTNIADDFIPKDSIETLDRFENYQWLKKTYFV